VKHGLVLDTSLFNKCHAFLKQMCERFPSPKAQSIQIGIEGIGRVTTEHCRNFCDSITTVHYDLLEQVNHLLNDSIIFGDVIDKRI